MDTKGAELGFVAGIVRDMGVRVVTVDVGTLGPPTVPPEIARETILAGRVLGQADRGAAVTAFLEARGYRHVCGDHDKVFVQNAGEHRA